MRKFLIDLTVNAVGFFAAIMLLQNRGIEPQGNTSWVTYVVLAVIFAFINATLRPVLVLLGCPLLILTLGLGMLVINTLLFSLTGWIGARFGTGFAVEGFWPAFLGAIIVSVVGMALRQMLRDNEKRSRS